MTGAYADSYPPPPPGPPAGPPTGPPLGPPPSRHDWQGTNTASLPGEGRAAAVGDTLVVHYVGTLADGTVFDESWSRGEPFPVTLGTGAVIAGWEEGLVGAKVGERRRLVIGAGNAYGDQDNGVIPANAPLGFEVDVIDLYR
jgi:peptidylprolyl isomerase